jgi:heme A synthase
VIVQGLLGGFRVQLNALFGPELSIVHGAFAQMYFAFLAGFTFLLGQRAEPVGEVAPEVGSLRRVASLALHLALVQVVLGALLRHSPSGFWLECGGGHRCSRSP